MEEKDICPFCQEGLSEPVLFIPLLPLDVSFPAYYEGHQGCYSGAEQEEISRVEGLVLAGGGHGR